MRRRHLRAQPRRPGRGEHRRRTSTRSSTTPSGPSCSSRTPAAGARSGPASRSACAPTRAGTCRSRRSASCSAREGALAGLTIGNDVSSREIEGANPLYLPQAKLFAGACALGPAVLVPDDWDAPFEIRMRIVDAERRRAVRGRDLDRTHAPLVRRARRLAAARQPGSGRERPAHRHRPRPAGRLHARARPRGRDPRPGNRHADEPGRRRGRPACPREGARSMPEVLEAPVRPAFANFVGGEWRPSASGRTYEKRNPWRPSELVGEFPASGEEDVNAAVEAAAAAFPEWSRRPAAQRAAVLMRGRRRDRAARRADGAGHDARDGQAAPRGAHGGGARRGDPPLLRRRGVASQGRALRAVGDGLHRLHDATAARRRRPDHAVELPRRDPGLEVGARPRLRQHRRHQARAGGATDRPAHRGGASRRPACRPASSTSSSAAAPRSAPRSSRHPQVQAISFTGSVAVGYQVREEATALGKRVQLELGGHNPLIVMADADLDRAVEAAYAGAFWSAGQKCTATRRIYVQDTGLRRVPRTPARAHRARRGRRPGRPGHRGRADRQREAARRDPRRDRARQGRGRHGARGRRADRRRRLPARADAVRGTSPTTRSSPARRSSGRSRRSTASPTSTRRSAARTQSSSGSRRRSSRAISRPRNAS